jgi:hypothetical protein
MVAEGCQYVPSGGFKGVALSTEECIAGVPVIDAEHDRPVDDQARSDPFERNLLHNMMIVSLRVDDQHINLSDVMLFEEAGKRLTRYVEHSTYKCRGMKDGESYPMPIGNIHMGSGLVNGGLRAGSRALAFVPCNNRETLEKPRLKPLFGRRGRTQHASGTSVEPVFRSTDCLVVLVVQGLILRPELSEKLVVLFGQSGSATGGRPAGGPKTGTAPQVPSALP